MKYLKVPVFLTSSQVVIYFITKLFLNNEFVLNNLLDDQIPFVPYFIYFYISWYILLFLVPIILGVKGSKQRSINGFYMSMSIVPMGLMTGVTWVRYGYQAMQNFNYYVQQIVSSGLSQGLAEKLVYVGSVGGVILLILACTQFYLGIKNRDLFI